MNVIKTDKFNAHYQEMKSPKLISKLEKLEKEIGAEQNPMSLVLLAKSHKLEEDIYVYRMSKYRLFWTVIGKDILFVDIMMRSWLHW